MDTTSKAGIKNKTASQTTNYNPWNFLFNSRSRTESEISNSSTDSYQTCKFSNIFIIIQALLF